MKKLGLGLLGLAAAIVVALLVAPGFVDWNAQKGRISAEVLALTGRDLTIDGDVSLAILPTPGLSVSRARLANIEGGGAPAMIELEALKVRIAFLPLLQGEVRVESVELIEPRILAEVLPDGRKNWELPVPAESSGAQLGGRGEGIAAAISLEKVTITGGTLIYRDATRGIEERIETLNAEIVAKSLKGPFEASGQASIRDLAVEFDLSMGRLVSAGATPVNLAMGVPDVEATLQLIGALSLHGEELSWRGRLKSVGKDLAALAAALPLDGALPAIYDKPFILEADVAAGREQVAIDKLAVQLADSKVEGEILLTLEPRPDLRVRLSATRIDLDEWRPPGDADTGSGQDPAAPDTPAPSPAAADPAHSPAWAGLIPSSLPTDMSASLDVSVDAVVYRGQVVRQFLLSLALEEGRLKLNQALALFPGSSDASLTGVVAPADVGGQPGLRFDGRLDAGSDNLRGILDWLGIDVAAVPASRLRKMSLAMNIGATRSDIMLGDIDFRVDLSRASGGVAIALRNRLGVGVGLALDKIDLDAYLPVNRRVEREEGAPSAAGPQEAIAAGTMLVAPAGLARFDANFDLRVGAMTLNRNVLRNLHLDATLRQGAVAVRELLVGDIAGGTRLRMAGTFVKLTTAPVMDAAYDLSVLDPEAFAKVLGVAPDLFVKAKSLDITGTVQGSQDQVEVTGEAKALGGRLTAQGRIKPLAVPLEFDLDLSGEHGDLAKLVSALVSDIDLDPGFGALDLRAKAVGTPEKISLSAVTGQLGPFTLDGGLRVELGAAGSAVGDVDMTIAVKHADLAALVRPFAGETGFAPGLGLDLQARVQGARDALRFSGIAGKLGPSEIEGTLELDMSGPRPKLSADLATGALPLAAFMGAAPGAQKTKPAAKPSMGAGSASGAEDAKVSPRWSRKVVDTDVLSDIDAEVKLNAEALILESARLDKVLVEASLKEGVIDLNKFGGTIYDGAVQISGKIDTREGLDAGLAVTVIELNLAKMAKELADSARVSGPLNLDASLTAKGRSEAELVSSLAGAGVLDGTLNVKVKAEEQIGNIVLGILGQKVKEIRGVSDATSVLFGAFAGTPAALKGTFTIDKGVAETDDLRLDGRQASAVTKGRADLAAWRIDTRTDVFREADPDTPYLTAVLTGPLDKPNPKISGQPFRRETAPAPVAPAPAAPVEPAQTPEPPLPQPEDLFKKGLEGLLKKLKQ